MKVSLKEAELTACRSQLQELTKELRSSGAENSLLRSAGEFLASVGNMDAIHWRPLEMSKRVVYIFVKKAMPHLARPERFLSPLENSFP